MKNLLGILVVALIVIGCQHVGPVEEYITPDDTDTDTDTDTGCTKGEYNGYFHLLTQADLVMLAGYTSLAGHLSINCPECPDLDALGCLTSVDGYLNIFGNNELTDLDGLNGLTSVTNGGVHIYFNASLPDCEACSFLSQLNTTPDPTDIHHNLEDDCSPAPDGC